MSWSCITTSQDQVRGHDACIMLPCDAVWSPSASPSQSLRSAALTHCGRRCLLCCTAVCNLQTGEGDNTREFNSARFPRANIDAYGKIMSESTYINVIIVDNRHYSSILPSNAMVVTDMVNCARLQWRLGGQPAEVVSPVPRQLGSPAFLVWGWWLCHHARLVLFVGE